jgi:cardiolipin synthase
MARLEGAAVGPALAQVRHCFERSWARAAAADRHVRGAEIPAPPHDPAFGYLVNAPRPPLYRQLYEVLLGQIRSARHGLCLTTPYFLPDRRFLRALVAARRRGVRVSLMVPAASDHPVVDALSRGVTRRLARLGVEVRYFRDHMIHAKTAIIDDAWAFVGSLNLDRLSFRLNLESAVVSRDPAFLADLGRQYARDLDNSQANPSSPAVHPLADPLLEWVGRWL